MKLVFYGAAREVTGSCHYISSSGRKMLIDCGLQQGKDEKENQQFDFVPGLIDYVFITHAHIDHSGRLPLLAKQGFRGKIFATEATCRLLDIMLRDSAHIQELEAQWKRRKGARAGRDTSEPLYSMEDAEAAIELLVPCKYDSEILVEDGIKIRFVDAGHLLGSSAIELWVTENGTTEKIVFSGDIGNINQPLTRDPQFVGEADYVVMESTYGDKNHEPPADYVETLAKIIDDTLMAGGNIVIPSFAVGRTQEILYFIREMKEKGSVKSFPNFPVYVDSPLASEATKIYSELLETNVDEETQALIDKGINPLSFPNLRFVESSDESRELNDDPTPKVIISSSGMCEAGRVRHHLKHNLWRSECSVVFVGYQAGGTLGRLLLDGAPKVKLFGEEIAVNAKIHLFKGISAHADRDKLIRWISKFESTPKKVFVVHGESDVSVAFADTLTRYGFSALAPNYEAEYDLLSNTLLSEGIPHLVVKDVAKTKKFTSPAFARLVAAGEYLMRVIKQNEGGANRDLGRFADQINSLADKWEV